MSFRWERSHSEKRTVGVNVRYACGWCLTHAISDDPRDEQGRYLTHKYQRVLASVSVGLWWGFVVWYVR